MYQWFHGFFFMYYVCIFNISVSSIIAFYVAKLVMNTVLKTTTYQHSMLLSLGEIRNCINIDLKIIISYYLQL